MEYYLGNDRDVPGWKIYAYLKHDGLFLEVKTEDGKGIEHIELPKEQALKLAELIKQKYGNK